MIFLKQEIDDSVIESLWEEAVRLEKFYTWQLYSLSLLLSENKSYSKDIAYNLVRRLVSIWSKEGKIFKEPESKRNSQWFINNS